MEDLVTRNARLCHDFANGEPMTSISRRTGISTSQLHRIFKAAGAKRKKFELDKAYFDANSHLTNRQISIETGIKIARVGHLKRIAYGTSESSGRLDFSNSKPSVDPKLITNKRWLRRQYVANGFGTPTIAKMLGCKTRKVITALQEFGIPLRTIKESMAKYTKRPTKRWLQTRYVKRGWSIQRCADEFKVEWITIYSALIEYGIPTRSASEQHVGELNEFYGKEHDEATKELCREIGTKAAREYWTTGDVQEKAKKLSEISKARWANPANREASSKRITALCQQGKCNSKKIAYTRPNGTALELKSTWEAAIAEGLDHNPDVLDWEYESLAIPYQYEGVTYNFLIDFEVMWKDGRTTYIECKNRRLLSLPKEQAKIAAAKRILGEGLTVVSKKPI